MGQRGYTGTQWYVRGTLTLLCVAATAVLLPPLLAYKLLEGVMLALDITREHVAQVWRTPSRRRSKED